MEPRRKPKKFRTYKEYENYYFPSPKDNDIELFDKDSGEFGRRLARESLEKFKHLLTAKN